MSHVCHICSRAGLPSMSPRRTAPPLPPPRRPKLTVGPKLTASCQLPFDAPRNPPWTCSHFVKQLRLTWSHFVKRQRLWRSAGPTTSRGCWRPRASGTGVPVGGVCVCIYVYIYMYIYMYIFIYIYIYKYISQGVSGSGRSEPPKR